MPRLQINKNIAVMWAGLLLVIISTVGVFLPSNCDGLRSVSPDQMTRYLSLSFNEGRTGLYSYNLKRHGMSGVVSYSGQDVGIAGYPYVLDYLAIGPNICTAADCRRHFESSDGELFVTKFGLTAFSYLGSTSCQSLRRVYTGPKNRPSD